LKSQSPNETVFAHLTMSSNNNANGGNDGSEPATNPRARVASTPENPHGYPPFDMRLVPNYTNNQITFYYTTGVIPAAEQTRFQQLMKQRKTSMDLIGWDGASDDDERRTDDSDDSETPEHENSDSDCPAPLPGYKGIKVTPSDIPKLLYNSTVAQYNNWLADLKAGFDGDPARFPTSRQKIILASITLDEQLKTTFNSASKDSPILSHHWRKFEQWLRDVVLHRGSDKLKLSQEFTAARQTLKEDPNQFYIRLFNLGIQSERTVTTEDYRTRLLKPLQNLMDQHDREYPTIQDAVTHAGRLWLTLDREKIRQEIKEEREKAHQRQRNPGQSNQQTDTRNNAPQGQAEEQRRGSRRGSRRDSRRQGSRLGSRRDRDHEESKDSRPRLSFKERQHRRDKDLCFNCGYPGHSKRDCSYPFNPNRVLPREPKEDQTKSQPFRARSNKRARAQPLRADSPSSSDHDVHTTDESEPERPRKRQKN
jgi:hypothetical protein